MLKRGCIYYMTLVELLSHEDSSIEDMEKYFTPL